MRVVERLTAGQLHLEERRPVQRFDKRHYSSLPWCAFGYASLELCSVFIQPSLSATQAAILAPSSAPSPMISPGARHHAVSDARVRLGEPRQNPLGTAVSVHD